MKEMKGIVFDWDGVIVDSMPYIAHGIQETAASFGVNISVEDVLKNYIQPKEAYYQSIGVDISNPIELTKRHLAFINKNEKLTSLFPEVMEVLSFLHKNGYILGVVSSADKDFILREIKRLGLSAFFDTNLIPEGGPKKEVKLATFVQLVNIKPDNFFYVGDLPTDVIVGRAAGMKVVAIGRNEYGYKRLYKLKPDYIFLSLEGLKSLLQD